MTYFYYKTYTTGDSGNDQQISKETQKLWKRYSTKKNWRITQLPNGYYQTEWNDKDDNWSGVTRRETIEAAESAIDSSITHYKRRLALSEGPKVVKTFK